MTEELWLTYTEAAGKLGIKLDSVKRRVRARKWPRMTGNDGIVRIQIPHDALPDDRTEGRSVNQAEPDADLADVRPPNRRRNPCCRGRSTSRRAIGTADRS